MVSELQTVVVETSKLASFVHETVDSPIRAPSKSPCLIRRLSARLFYSRAALCETDGRCELPEFVTRIQKLLSEESGPLPTMARGPDTTSMTPAAPSRHRPSPCWSMRCDTGIDAATQGAPIHSRRAMPAADTRRPEGFRHSLQVRSTDERQSLRPG